jgi:hypothetical protein
VSTIIVAPAWTRKAPHAAVVPALAAGLGSAPHPQDPRRPRARFVTQRSGKVVHVAEVVPRIDNDDVILVAGPQQVGRCPRIRRRLAEAFDMVALRPDVLVLDPHLSSIAVVRSLQGVRRWGRNNHRQRSTPIVMSRRGELETQPSTSPNTVHIWVHRPTPTDREGAFMPVIQDYQAFGRHIIRYRVGPGSRVESRARTNRPQGPLSGPAQIGGGSILSMLETRSSDRSNDVITPTPVLSAQATR